ncbi:MAG: PAS domain S-box protein [Chitinivibrionales bacterium]|nr:PAS domain S-box protein [Chitinivibrionales bacterium]
MKNNNSNRSKNNPVPKRCRNDAVTPGLYKTILENISDAVFLTDTNGKLNFVCDNVKYIFGYSVGEIIRKRNIHRIIDGLDYGPDKLRRKGEIRNIECSITNKFGECRNILVNVKLADMAEGTLLFTCRDITDRKRVESELARKNTALLEVIASVEREKIAVKESVAEKFQKLIIPIIDMIADRPHCADLAKLLKSSIKYVTSSPAAQFPFADYNLSPREMQICNMIQTGMSIKQIAGMLHTSPLTVEKQRKSIRKKLGVSDNRTNLATYLGRINS